MDIGKVEKVTEVPKPIRVPIVVKPIRRPVPTREPVKTGGSITAEKIPYDCPVCGRELENVDNEALVCPKHGLVVDLMGVKQGV